MNRQPRMRDVRWRQGARPDRDAGVSVTLRGAIGPCNAADGAQITFAGGGLMNGPGLAGLRRRKVWGFGGGFMSYRPMSFAVTMGLLLAPPAFAAAASDIIVP